MPPKNGIVSSLAMGDSQDALENILVSLEMNHSTKTA